MTLEDKCNEYSKNFAALHSKYDALSQELERCKDACDAQKAQLDAAEQVERKSREEVRRLTKELEDASIFKERLLASNIAMEHLKGRLESAKKQLTEKDAEHLAEVEQLRGQMRDLLKRVEVNADAPTLQAVRNQKVELEERCALVTGQLLEEKERNNQHQLSANALVRDLQWRNTECEQRCRAMEAELGQLRSTLRKTIDTQNDAVLQKDRLALECQRLQEEMSSRKQELEDLKFANEEQAARMADAATKCKNDWEHEKETLRMQLVDASKRVDDMSAQRAADAERFALLQRSVQARILAAKDEYQLELDSAQQARSAALSDCQRLQWKLTRAEQELEAARNECAQLNARNESSAAQILQLQGQLEAALQSASWSAAEKDRLNAQLQQLHQRLEESSATEKALEALTVEHERAMLQLQFAQAEHADTKRAAERLALASKCNEDAYNTRYSTIQHAMHDLKKRHKHETERMAREKQKLMALITERDQQLAALAGSGRIAANSEAAMLRQPQKNADVVTGCGLDAIAMLRAQSEAAQQVQDMLQAMRGSSPSLT